jgi:hypothetical protein
MSRPTAIVGTCRRVVLTGVPREPVWSELSGKLTFLRYAEATCEVTQKRGFVVYAYAEQKQREVGWKKLFDAETAKKVGEFEECERYRRLKAEGRLKTLGKPLCKDVVREKDAKNENIENIEKIDKKRKAGSSSNVNEAEKESGKRSNNPPGKGSSRNEWYKCAHICTTKCVVQMCRYRHGSVKPTDTSVKHGAVTLRIDRLQCTIRSPACTAARWSVAGHLALATSCGCCRVGTAHVRDSTPGAETSQRPPSEGFCFVCPRQTLTDGVHLIIPYLFGDFHTSHIQEYAGGLLFALEKPAKDGGGIRPIICGESWRRCFASLAANAVRGPISHIFTSTYETFYKLQVSRMALPTAPRFFLPCTPHLTLTPLTLT